MNYVRMCEKDHPDLDDACAVCQMVKQFLADPGAFLRAKPKPKARCGSAPCLHLGAPVRGAAAPDTLRDYRTCDHPDRPLGAVVCSCRGCGKKCPGYEA
jgi:hypothetical protein